MQWSKSELQEHPLRRTYPPRAPRRHWEMAGVRSRGRVDCLDTLQEPRSGRPKTCDAEQTKFTSQVATGLERNGLASECRWTIEAISDHRQQTVSVGDRGTDVQILASDDQILISNHVIRQNQLIRPRRRAKTWVHFIFLPLEKALELCRLLNAVMLFNDA